MPHEFLMLNYFFFWRGERDMGVWGRMPIRNCRNNNRVGAFNNAPLGRIRFDVGFCCILYIYIFASMSINYE